jgi:hypothetical protein
MALTIAANLSKKVPIVGTDYSSQSASITITAEVGDLSQVATEAQKLYHLAEQAVDAQLAGNPPVDQPVPAPPPARPGPSQQPRHASQPYKTNGQRRGPAPVTESQLKYLRRLVDQTKASLPAILQQFQVGDLTQLSCRDAAQLIDELKQVSA